MDDFARAQIQALQRRVDALERHLGLAPPPQQVDPHLAEMLRAGRMVQAIKVYADQNGVDLMTAKQAIEGIHAEGNY
jgi:ribosomal protein L7/L12